MGAGLADSADQQDGVGLANPGSWLSRLGYMSRLSRLQEPAKATGYGSPDSPSSLHISFAIWLRHLISNMYMKSMIC